MKKITGKKGMVLISAYLALSVIGTFSYAVFSKNLAVLHASQRTGNRIIAFHLAEAGIDQAIVQLRTNSNFAGQGYTALGRGGYSSQVTSPDPQLNPTLRRIIGGGEAPNNLTTSYAYEQRQAVAHVNFPPNVNSYAIFSGTSIQMSGNAGTDSYDSRVGSYAEQTPRENGDMGTNTTRAGFVMLSGNVKIAGDATVGPNGNPNTVITTSGNVQITGTRTAAPSLLPLPSVQVPANLTNSGNLSLTGNTTMTLPGGSYWYSSINITGNGRLNFTGPATVYVTGNMIMTGNGRAASQDAPANLSIKVWSMHNATLSGNAKLYGTLYGNDVAVKLSGNAAIFGSVIGNTIQQSGNAKVHYDEAMSTNVTNGSKSTLMAWQEN